MSQFGDDLYLGNADSSQLPGVSGAPSPNGGRGFGPLGRVYLYDIVPAALAANNLSTTASPGTNAIVLTAGAGVTAVVDAQGVTRYVLDVPRAIRYVSGSDDTGITFTTSGYDYLGNPMSETTTGANGTATGKKAFASITGVVQSGAVAGTLTIGTTDVFGLPVAVPNVAYLLQAKWDSTLAANAGTFVAADAGPASPTTGDPRGTYAQAGSASNGVRRLILAIGMTAIQVGPNATKAGLFGVV